MRLKIVGGSLEVEIEGDLLEEARKQLAKAAQEEEKIVKEGIKSGEQDINKLNPKQKLPI